MAKSNSNEKNFGHDKSSFANLPQDVKMSLYPKTSHENARLDDTIEQIDSTNDKSVSKSKKYISNQH
jgi:hypothetical protein